MILPRGDTSLPWVWPNFSRAEMACKHCGEQYYWPEFMDALQAMRDELGPLKILSAHRCRLHNARVGGAPLSQHLRLAVDIRVQGHDRKLLAKTALKMGFTGRGYYNRFLHLDFGKDRIWFGNGARAQWQ